jgi:hypothetical protein
MESTILVHPALNGGEWLASRPDRFIHWENAPSTQCVRDWIGLKAGLYAMKKGKSLLSAGNGTANIDTVVHHYTAELSWLKLLRGFLWNFIQ